VHRTSKADLALPQKLLVAVGAVCCSISSSGQAQAQLPPECPRRGTLEIVADPAAWSDQCFAATNGRAPRPGVMGETASATRDIDLDGVDEHLEIRGVGNAIKQIFVFRASERGFLYLGELNANRAFTVAPDPAGIPTISYIYRAGAEDLSLRRVQYRDGLFVEISSEEALPDAP
jgi:hypothetical protein